MRKYPIITIYSSKHCNLRELCRVNITEVFEVNQKLGNDYFFIFNMAYNSIYNLISYRFIVTFTLEYTFSNW